MQDIMVAFHPHPEVRRALSNFSTSQREREQKFH